MRILVLALALLAAACSGSSSASTTVPASEPTSTVQSPPTDAGTTTTTSSLAASTTTPGSVTTSSISVTPLPASICDPYLDYLSAFDRPHELDALRRFDIAVGFPRPETESQAIAVLREQLLLASMSTTEARATLTSNYGPGCGEPGPGYAGRYDQLATRGVIVTGQGPVRLLDGADLVPVDPAGPHVDAFGTRAGGIVAVEEIGGLEVVEYRSAITAIPRDLALDVDMRLHDMAVVDGVEYAMVTIWEASGEFGEGTQYLDLLPLNGDAPRRIGVVGGVAEAAETISSAGGFFLVTEAFLGGSDIYALSLDGQRRDVPGLPLVGDGVPGVSTLPLQRARVDPTGERFAYLRVTPGVGAGGVDVIGTELVVQRLDDGTEELSVEIGGRDEIFTSLDYDGHWVIAARTGSLVVVDTWAGNGPDVAQLSVDGILTARFLDAGLRFEP